MEKSTFILALYCYSRVSLDSNSSKQLFAKVVSDGLDSTWLLLRGKETKHFYVALMVVMTGEGNGTPLQYSCLGNPMDGGAW